MNYDVFHRLTGFIVDTFDDRKDAELWIAEQPRPNDYEIAPPYQPDDEFVGGK